MKIRVDDLAGLPPLVPLATAGRLLGLGRNKVYEMAARGEFPVEVLRLGSGPGSLKVRRADLLRYLGAEPDYGGQP